MDATRKLARLEFKDVEGELLGEAGQAAEPFAKTMTQAVICLANEMAGGADKLRETTLDYVQMRMQFGRPLAAFQSMKHKQADMLVEVETAKAAAYYAAAAFDAKAKDLWRRLRSPRQPPRTPTCRRRSTRSSAAAASVLRGMKTRICGSSGRRARKCSSATRIIIAN